MDGPSFQSFVASLRANGNEMARKQMAFGTLQARYVTARQLSILMDQFPNEIFRLEVGRTGVLHVVDPENAQGLATKFTNPNLSAQYAQVASQQH